MTRPLRGGLGDIGPSVGRVGSCMDESERSQPLRQSLFSEEESVTCLTPAIGEWGFTIFVEAVLKKYVSDQTFSNAAGRNDLCANNLYGHGISKS